MTSHVDLGSVQAGVVRGYPAELRCTRYVFLKLEQPALGAPTMGAARVVADWLSMVSFDRLPEESTGNGDGSPDPGSDEGAAPQLNVAFTHRGLEALGVPADLRAALPTAFREGAVPRAGALGDHWQHQTDPPPIPLHEADLALVIHSRTPGEGEARWKQLDDSNQRGDRPFKVVHTLDAAFSKVDKQRERFGYADGRSQPAIEGVDIDAVGNGVYARLQPTDRRSRRRVRLEGLGLRSVSHRWRLIRTGEFLLGYENEDGRLPAGSTAPLGPNSTFMVYREIDQHVDVFRQYVTEWAQRTGLSEDQLRAKIVGRRPDGTPAVRLHNDPSHVPGNRRRSNDFLYSHDPGGAACPLGAHVRRANPRDALPGGAEVTMRHRIIRRGMPYGPATGDYGEDRQGLAFVCFNASIENGFEFIQKHWINSGQVLGLGAERDFLLQEREAPTRMVIEGFRPAVLDPPKDPFVTVRGCEYLFVPSRSACTWLASMLLRS